MKSDIHPNYHMIKVVMTNGVEFMTRSTYGEDGATLHLDIDPNTRDKLESWKSFWVTSGVTNMSSRAPCRIGPRA